MNIDYYPFGMVMPGRNEQAGDGYRYGFNGMEMDDEVSGERNSYTAEFWKYDPRLGRRWNIDPVVVPTESPYATFRNSPISLNDPDGDCPDCKDGEYQIEKGDNFWSLEEKWNMEHGSLSNMNLNINPNKLQIGQTIRTTLIEGDLADGIKLNSDESLKGMDNFFKKDAQGVNRVQEITEEEFSAQVQSVASSYWSSMISNMAKVKTIIRHNSTGGLVDMKKYKLNNQEQYEDDFPIWFKEQTSVSEPATRTLYVYKGIAYNLNEFGNLQFGAVHSVLGTSLKSMLFAADAYSIWTNGKKDSRNEVDAIKRGYGYGKSIPLHGGTITITK